MKKTLLLYFVLAVCFAGGIIFKYYFHYPFFGGMCTGASLMLLVFVTVGKILHEKGLDRMAKAMNDLEEAENFKK